VLGAPNEWFPMLRVLADAAQAESLALTDILAGAKARVAEKTASVSRDAAHCDELHSLAAQLGLNATPAIPTREEAASLLAEIANMQSRIADGTGRLGRLGSALTGRLGRLGSALTASRLHGGAGERDPLQTLKDVFGHSKFAATRNV
jgi:hypothetical protein